MRLMQAVVWLIMLIPFFLATEATAQNPSFDGREFRQVWADGTVPVGASTAPTITEVYLNPAGVCIRSKLAGNGIYFVHDGGAYTVAAKFQPEFSQAAWFDVLGWKPDGSLLICPLANALIYPCQIYNGSGLAAISSPTPEQRINLSNYFDGRMVYLEHAGLGAVNIWYYSAGNPAALWLDNSDFSDLATILDYDGETLAFAAGTTGAFDVWLRASNGTLTRIIGNGDPMPGASGTTFTSDPDHANVEIDQGKVYIMGAGSGSDVVLFSSTDGASFDVIAKVGLGVPGRSGITITAMELKQVRNGKIWIQVSQSDGDTVLYQIIGSTWARVVGKKDSFDGRAATGFAAYEHGSLGDSVVIAVSFFIPTYPFSAIDLYSNAELPGFSAIAPGLVMEIDVALGGNLSITSVGAAGAIHTLQATSSLTNSVWDTVGLVVADGAGLMEWTGGLTNDARFFRLVE